VRTHTPALEPKSVGHSYYTLPASSQLTLLKNQRNAQRRSRQAAALSSMYNLRQLQTHTTVDRVFRFAANATLGTGIAARDFCYCLAIGTYDGIAQDDLFPLFAAVKVRSIEMWAAPASNATTTVSLDVTRTIGDTSFTYNQHLEDTSISNANPAHLKWTPKMGEYLYDWVTPNETASAVQILGPANTIIDVHITGIVNMRPGVASVKKSNTTSSYPTLGVSPLDLNNVAGSRHILPTSSSDQSWV
jgi:hypothetical protein